jgi:hypothetical protein
LNTKILAVVVAAALSGVAQAGDIQFTNAPVPTNDLDKRSILTSQFAVVDGEKTKVKYNTLMRSGDELEGSAASFGQIFDIAGQPVIFEDGSLQISDDNDFSSLLQGKRGG